MAKTKKPKIVEPYWSEIVKIWFDFCRDKFGDSPVFDNSAPRDLKGIIKILHERAIAAGDEWTLLNAQQRFSKFLEWSFKDKWLSENWLLFNINRQKDKIFYNIRKSINQQPVDPFQ